MKRPSRKASRKSDSLPAVSIGYDDVLASVVDVLDAARRTSARTVNAIMTAAYWEIGRRIVEGEQGGNEQAEYGQVLVVRLAADLAERFGRGFSKSNLYQMRTFYLAYQDIFQTVSGKFGRVSADESSGQIFQTPSGKVTTPQKMSANFELSAIHEAPSGESALSHPMLSYPKEPTGEEFTVKTGDDNEDSDSSDKESQ